MHVTQSQGSTHKRCRTGGPATSRAAAEASHEVAENHWLVITETLWRRRNHVAPWMTVEQIAERTALTPHQIGRRVNELVRQGIIEIAGVAPLESGRLGRTYMLTKLGQQEVQR
jgi:hypothetical protein